MAVGVTGSYCWWDHQCSVGLPSDYIQRMAVVHRCEDDTPGLCEKAGNGEIVWMVAATEAGIEIVGMKL